MGYCEWGVAHGAAASWQNKDAEGGCLSACSPDAELSKATRQQVSQVLAQNVTAGTGRRAALESGQPSAGKTGAQDFSDAWYVGFTPQLSTAVWMGHPEEEVSMVDIQGRAGTGGWVGSNLG